MKEKVIIHFSISGPKSILEIVTEQSTLSRSRSVVYCLRDAFRIQKNLYLQEENKTISLDIVL